MCANLAWLRIEELFPANFNKSLTYFSIKFSADRVSSFLIMIVILENYLFTSILNIIWVQAEMEEGKSDS